MTPKNEVGEIAALDYLKHDFQCAASARRPDWKAYGPCDCGFEQAKAELLHRLELGKTPVFGPIDEEKQAQFRESMAEPEPSSPSAGAQPSAQDCLDWINREMADANWILKGIVGDGKDEYDQGAYTQWMDRLQELETAAPVIAKFIELTKVSRD